MVLSAVGFTEELEVAPIAGSVAIADSAVDVDAVLYELEGECGLCLCDAHSGGAYAGT